MPRPRFSTTLGVVISGTVVLLLYILFSLSHNGFPKLHPVVERPKGVIYKNMTAEKVRPPITDNFSLADTIYSPRDFPSIPTWNRAVPPKGVPRTPLFIGFTRNWPMLQQVVVSYITAGWPPEDIIVVDNTGTMYSNKNGLLSLQNPHFLNHTRLESFGVKVMITPTLLTFAQLQNFYIFQALEHGWEYYFWGHMDVMALSDEKFPLQEGKFKGLYARAMDRLLEVTSKDYLRNEETGEQQEWGIQFFAYDWLALNKVESFLKIGAWDTFISYYTIDCDMHSRFHMHKIAMPATDAGIIADVTGSIDLTLLFRRIIDPNNPPKTAAELNALPEDKLNGTGFQMIEDEIKRMNEAKNNGEEERNSWQYQQTGGQGEPFYREPQGFEKALQMSIKNGVDTYQEKWGHIGCNLQGTGLKPEDAWRVEHDDSWPAGK